MCIISPNRIKYFHCWVEAGVHVHTHAQQTSRVLESQFELEVQRVTMGNNQEQVSEGPISPAVVRSEAQHVLVDVQSSNLKEN